MTTYSLLPFTDQTTPWASSPLALAIFAHVTATDSQLSLGYELIGDIRAIAFADVNSKPQRRDNLWEQTCFECFLAPQHSRQYWEFNLSPSRDWNCYRFEDYRRGMMPEPAWHTAPFQIDQQIKQSDRYLLTCRLDLRPLFSQPVPLQLGITMVVADYLGNLSYWALSHPVPKADFHQRKSWLITL
ncbi:MAG: DOMON-like domain-containing protein [Synechocystis sp.]|nr:DOMON-like domain-containing protein [Synechocystis sp.]